MRFDQAGEGFLRQLAHALVHDLAALQEPHLDTARTQPEQREEAWNTGFEAGDPTACDSYLDPANFSS